MRFPRSFCVEPKHGFHLIWKMHNSCFLLDGKDAKRLYLRCVFEDLVDVVDASGIPVPRNKLKVLGASRLSSLNSHPSPNRKGKKKNRSKSKKPRNKSRRGSRSNYRKKQKNLKAGRREDEFKLKRKPDAGFDLHAYCIMDNHLHSMSTLHSDSTSLSKHMRNSHSRFAQSLNKMLDRSGAVGNDRPKTLPIEDIEGQIRVALYIFTNPVRAGIVKDPCDIRIRHMSSCRLFTHGEKTEFSAMIVLPDWYLALGKTPRKRQAKFRKLLRLYLIEFGLMRKPELTEGFYIGSKAWGQKRVASARAYAREQRKKAKEGSTAFT